MFKVVEVFHYVLSQDAFFLDLKKKENKTKHIRSLNLSSQVMFSKLLIIHVGLLWLCSP